MPVTDPSPVYALLLAAGLGSRFGGNKLLADLHGRPLIAHVAATLAECIANGALAGGVAVVPRNTTDLAWTLDTAGLTLIENPAPNSGLASSIKIGVRAVADMTNRPNGPTANRPTGILVLLADQPLLR